MDKMPLSNTFLAQSGDKWWIVPVWVATGCLLDKHLFDLLPKNYVTAPG